MAVSSLIKVALSLISTGSSTSDRTGAITSAAVTIVGDTADYTNIVSGIPIPSLETLEKDFDLNFVRLSDDYRIYILESRPGEFMSKKYLTTKNKIPDKIKNGFSRGIAINENDKEIIYWLCIW